MIIARLGTSYDAGAADGNPPNLFGVASIGGIISDVNVPTRGYYTVDNTLR